MQQIFRVITDNSCRYKVIACLCSYFVQTQNPGKQTNIHFQDLDLLVELNPQLVQGDVIHLKDTLCLEILLSATKQWDRYGDIFTHWIEFFHCYRFVVEDTFVHGAKASLSQPAAAIWHRAIVKITRDPHQLVEQETGDTWGETNTTFTVELLPPAGQTSINKKGCNYTMSESLEKYLPHLPRGQSSVELELKIFSDNKQTIMFLQWFINEPIQL